MDKNTVEQKYLNATKVNEIQTDNVRLSAESLKQHKQFVENNITMANSWIGASGDGFLFSANTLATFLAFTMEFFDKNQDLLGKYKLTFGDIDKQLSELNRLEEH